MTRTRQSVYIRGFPGAERQARSRPKRSQIGQRKTTLCGLKRGVSVVFRALAGGVLIVALGVSGASRLHAAEEAAASAYISLTFQGSCDDRNNRLWLHNTHTFKTVVTRVRWRAAGGKDLSEEFYPAPNSVREIGCAAEGEILSAEFAAF